MNIDSIRKQYTTPVVDVLVLKHDACLLQESGGLYQDEVGLNHSFHEPTSKA